MIKNLWKTLALSIAFSLIFVALTLRIAAANNCQYNDPLQLHNPSTALVMTAPKVYIVYWGWGDRSPFCTVNCFSDPQNEIPILESYLKNVGGTKWLNTVTQYYQNPSTPQYAGNPVGVYVSPSDLPPENWPIDSASRFDKRGGLKWRGRASSQRRRSSAS